VRATFTISGTFEQFDRAAFRTKLATYLRVLAESISLDFMAGSIIVLATVTYPTMMAATNASILLISATATALSTALGVTVANVTAPAVLQLFDAPSPPPRPYLPEYDIVSDKQMKFEVHGILMLIAWGLFAPLGLVVARYGKPPAAAPVAVKAKATDQPPAPAPPATWFVVHRACMYSAVVITLVASIISLATVEEHVNDAHKKIGVILTSVMLIQPVNAYFRPHKPKAGEAPSSARVAWEWGHRWLGRALVGLSFASLISGGELADAFYDREYYNVSVALVVIWCAVVCLCEAHRFCRWYSAPSPSGGQQEMVTYGQNNKA
jgi:cytochrome b561